MKMSGFEKYEKYSPRVLLVCTAITVGMLINMAIDSNNERTCKAKAIVQKYAPEKIETLTKSTKNEHIAIRTAKWEEVAKQISDSLKIDSIAKANYAKGAQMVRDSIKNANKVIK